MSPEPRPQGPRRPGRPSLTNEQLLDRALDLFLEQGFERTSIEAICAAAGMAKRTVYARYGDKTSLFKAALQRAIEEWIVPVERLRAAEGVDLEQSLLSVGGILLANIMSPAGLRLLRLTNAESGRLPEIGAYNVQAGTEPTIAYLAELFRRQHGRSRRPARSPRGGRTLPPSRHRPGNRRRLGRAARRGGAGAAHPHERAAVPARFAGGAQRAADGRRPGALLDKALAALDAAREQLLLAKAARPS